MVIWWRRPTQRTGPDRGAVLVLTLIFTVVLAMVVVALAQYVTVGLKTSGVATERTGSNADASNVMNWAIEQFAKKRLYPDDLTTCGEAPNRVDIPVPAALTTNGSTTTLQCERTNPVTNDPVVHLIATSLGVQTRVVEATVEVPAYTYGARVSDWRVDIPIDVPPYVPGSGSSGNSDPVADATTWTAPPDSVTSQALEASDTDGTIVNVTFSSVPNTGVPPADWVVTWTGGVSVDVAVPAGTVESAYPFNYEVTDDDGATASSTITVNVSSTPLDPPAPACSFVVTTNTNNNKAGTGTLTVSNTGGAFTGWSVRLQQHNPARPWQFNGWSITVTETLESNSLVEVGGSQTIGQNAAENFGVDLVQQSGSGTIDANRTLTCTVLSPAP